VTEGLKEHMQNLKIKRALITNLRRVREKNKRM
jgi:hypothetical protein